MLSGGPDTMVFDEVDAGIGGATALEVGRALAEVAEGSQVLVVTHLAQVAAHADQQVRIAKSIGEEATTTTVEPVDGEARLAELARMLSGTPDSTATLRRLGFPRAASTEGLNRQLEPPLDGL